jgi:hypothetical protein
MASLISASRRTDVPGLHTRWFLNRVRAGFCHVAHPYTARVTRVPLRPADVLAIVFWTRWPGPLLPHLEALRAEGYAMTFQLTVNGYGPPLEARNPPPERALAAAEEIARRLGPDAVQWRYDPVLLGGEWTAARHRARFTRLAARLEGITRRCTFSFVDFYGKTERNLAPIEAAAGVPFERPGPEEKRALAVELAALAAERGMSLRSCCDDSLVGGPVAKARCVDPDVAEAVAGRKLPALPAAPTRKDCGCARSVDIGTYDTCAFGCAYCYAVGSRATARRRLREADPRDSILWRPPSLRGADLDARAAETAPVRASRPGPLRSPSRAGRSRPAAVSGTPDPPGA